MYTSIVKTISIQYKPQRGLIIFHSIYLSCLQENANYEFLASVSMKTHAFLESTGQGLYCNLWGQEKN